MSGLRARKKARIRAAIQREALRLFRAHGYAGTTVEQIADAADVSASTVFRYFPTKEDMLALGEHHRLAETLSEVFAAQPPSASPVASLRAAIRIALDELPPAERAARIERDVALLAVPELWSANLGLLRRALDRLGELMARRAGRDPSDPEVRAVCGAVLGVAMRVFLDAADEPGGDAAAALDAGLAVLDTCLPPASPR